MSEARRSRSRALLVVMPWVVGGVEAAKTAVMLAGLEPGAGGEEPWVLAVGQGVGPEDRAGFEREIQLSLWAPEAQPLRALLHTWWFTPAIPSLSGVWNLAMDMARTRAGREPFDDSLSPPFDSRVLVVNDDLALRPDTLRRLTEVWGVYTDSRGVSPLLVSGVGRREESWAGDLVDALPGPEVLLRARGGPDFSCFLIDARGALELGGFDEGFIPAYTEDLDFHRRALLAGHGDRVFSVAVPYLHRGGGSGTLRRLSPERRALVERMIQEGSRTHYARKWGGPVNEEKWWAPEAPGAVPVPGLGEDPRTQEMFGRVREGWAARGDGWARGEQGRQA